MADRGRGATLDRYADWDARFRGQEERISQLEARHNKHVEGLLNLQRLQTEIAELEAWTSDNDIATRRIKLKLKYQDLFNELMHEAGALPGAPSGSAAINVAVKPAPPPSPMSPVPIKRRLAPYVSIPMRTPVKRRISPARLASPMDSERESIRPTKKLRSSMHVNTTDRDHAKEPLSAAHKPFTTRDRQRIAQYLASDPIARKGTGVNWVRFGEQNPDRSREDWIAYYRKHKIEIEEIATDLQAEQQSDSEISEQL